MPKFYPDIRNEDGIEAGANWGAMAAICLGFLALLGAVPSFFAVVRSAGIEGAEGFLLVNVNEGYFCDPSYGGNKDMAAWKMIGYPGVRADYLEFVGEARPYPYAPVSLYGKRG